MIKHYDDDNDCLNAREECCMRNEETGEIEGVREVLDKCEPIYRDDEECRFLPPNNALFRFTLNPKSILTEPNELIINV